jgi:hypothetical protein
LQEFRCLENPLPEDFAGNRLKLVRRQCKALALEILCYPFCFAGYRFAAIPTAKGQKRNGLTLSNALKQSADFRQNLPAA